MKVGIVGLGAGTLAAYGRPGDVYRFYEINPDVIRIARDHFTYLRDSAAGVEIEVGDGRLALEREVPQEFDILAIDAFSGDAIPVHLLTSEALALYLRHVRPDGIVAFHVSNRFLDLVPVVTGLARNHDAHAVFVLDANDVSDPTAYIPNRWVLVARDRAALERAAIRNAGAQAVVDRPEWRLWTDDYANVVQILR